MASARTTPDSTAALRPWLSLQHRVGGTSPADLLEPAPLGRLVWQDPEGGVYAVCERDGDELTVTIPRVARYRATAEPPIVAARAGGATQEAVMSMFHRFALPMLLQARGLELLHASAVRIDTGVVALCAESGVGKSTTAAALAARGWTAWADDVVALDIGAGPATAIGLPFEFRLDDSIAARPPVAGRPGGQCEQAPLTAIVVLERSHGVVIERLAAAEAFRRVFVHGMCFDLSDETRTANMFDRYFRIAAETPVFRIAFAPGLAHIDGLLDALERLAEEAAPRKVP